MSGPIKELTFRMIHFGHLIIESLFCDICIFSWQYVYILRGSSTCLSQTSLSLIFQSSAFHILYQLIFQTIDSADLHFWPSLSPDCTSQSLTNWENFPSLMSSDCYWATVHFLFILGCYGTNFEVHLSFFFFIHPIIRNSPMMLDTDWRKKSSASGKKAVRLHMFSGLAQAQYLV